MSVLIGVPVAQPVADPVAFGEPGQPRHETNHYAPDWNWCGWCEVEWNGSGTCWACGGPSIGNRIPLPIATRAGEDP